MNSKAERALVNVFLSVCVIFFLLSYAGIDRGLSLAQRGYQLVQETTLYNCYQNLHPPNAFTVIIIQPHVP